MVRPVAPDGHIGSQKVLIAKVALLGALLAVLLSASPSLADPFAGGITAEKQGDFGSALKTLLPLAQNGDARAQYSIGAMYTKGDGVEKSYAEALKWYKLSEAQGNANASVALGNAYRFGLGVTQDSDQAFKYFKVAADQRVKIIDGEGRIRPKPIRRLV
jgi:hypothetical protein